MTRTHATVTGFAAILLWSLLALLTHGTRPVPPLQLNVMTFAVGGAVGLVWIAMTGGFAQLRGVGWRAYAFGTIGLFGYHTLYFSALRLAPVAEAGLIAYLWPLLIVIFAGFLPGERLSRLHVLGGLVAFAGVALIVLKDGPSLSGAAMPGYMLAFLCALTWAGYSVLSRRLAGVPTAAVAVSCLATALLSLPLHAVFEDTVWPAASGTWLAILALGLGPVGLAFYLWDVGMKRGDIQLLGVASYAAPLLSTLALVVAGVGRGTAALAVSAILIVAGAALAAYASARARRAAPTLSSGARSLP